jgi:transketolase
MRERFVSTTAALLDEDPRIVVVLAEISVDRFRQTREAHPLRVVNVGIREELMIGVAGGLALTGMRPVAHSYAPFLVERPWESVKLSLSHQNAGAVLVSVGATYDASFYGRTHMAPADVALLDTLPGWTIHVPGHPDEVEPLLRQAVAGTDCAYLRLSTACNREPMPVSPGRFEVVRRGRRGTVIAVGPMLDRTLAASVGLDLTVLYAATVRPFDADTVRATLAEPDVAIVEPYLEGTSNAQIAAALGQVRQRVLGIGAGRDDLRRYGTPEQHDAAWGLDVEGIRARLVPFFAVP